MRTNITATAVQKMEIGQKFADTKCTGFTARRLPSGRFL
jgi:hypothetical protein